MNKIKIIDLLNKIAKGEEVPKRIIFNGEEYSLGYGKTYEDENSKYLLGGKYNNLVLNDEVEIIEEEKEIEKIENSELEELECLRDVTYFFQERVNELIDVVNELKRDKEC